jgi:mannitol operon transcriptional antiterminator
MKSVKGWFKEKNIRLTAKPRTGYKIICSEFDFRIAMIKCLSEIYADEIQSLITGQKIAGHIYSEWDQLFEGFGFSVIHDFVNEIMVKLKDKKVGGDYSDIVLYTALMVLRCKKGSFVDFSKDEIEKITNSAEFIIIDEKKLSLEEHFNIFLPLQELAALKAIFLPRERDEAFKIFDLLNLSQTSEDLARSIAKDAEKILRIPFTQQDSFINILSRHILNTMRKLKTGFSEGEAGLLDFKLQYPLESSIGEQFCELVKNKLNIKLPESEGIYIAMYIAAELEKINNVVNKKKKAILVSVNALSASTLLYWQLINNFSSQLDISEVCSYYEFVSKEVARNVDLVISTVPISGTSLTNLVISPLLTQKDIKKIKKFLDTEQHVNIGYNSIRGMIEESVVFLKEDVSSSKNLIVKIGSYLVESGYAQKGYVQELLNHESLFGSGLDMAMPIALPHAPPEFTRNTNLTIVTTNKKMKFKVIGGDGTIETKLVIFPLLNPDNSDGFYFYSFLSLLKNRKVTENLISCKTKEELVNLFTNV